MRLPPKRRCEFLWNIDLQHFTKSDEEDFIVVDGQVDHMQRHQRLYSFKGDLNE